MCLGLFLIIEMVVVYAVEPWLYGTHTGVSSLAILVSAAFWTTLWGPIGLVLSTPLTVCLLVLGRHAPQLEFLYVILGDEPVLAPEAELYQRLLALDQQEAQAAVDKAADGQSPRDVYDAILLPALRLSEEDRHRGGLDRDREDFIAQSMDEFIARIASRQEDENTGIEPERRVLILPAGDRADEITAAMLAHVLQVAGIFAIVLPRADLPGDSFANLKVEPGDVICISALSPFALMPARTLSKRLRARFPRQQIIVGLWSRAGEVEDFEAPRQRLRRPGGHDPERGARTFAGGADGFACASRRLTEAVSSCKWPLHTLSGTRNLYACRICDGDRTNFRTCHRPAARRRGRCSVGRLTFRFMVRPSATVFPRRRHYR